DLAQLVGLPGVGDEVVAVPEVVMILAETRLDARREGGVARRGPGEGMAADARAPARVPALGRLIERLSQPERGGLGERGTLAVADDGDVERRVGGHRL